MFGHLLLSLGLLVAVGQARFYGYPDGGDERQQQQPQLQQPSQSQEQSRQVVADIDAPFGLDDAPVSNTGEILLPPNVSAGAP